MIKTADDLLARLVARGGAIVSSGVCSEMEIADARARGDFYVDAKHLGYVLRLKAWVDKVHQRDGYMQPPAGGEGVVSPDPRKALSGTTSVGTGRGSIVPDQ